MPGKLPHEPRAIALTPPVCPADQADGLAQDVKQHESAVQSNQVHRGTQGTGVRLFAHPAQLDRDELTHDQTDQITPVRVQLRRRKGWRLWHHPGMRTALRGKNLLTVFSAWKNYAIN